MRCLNLSRITEFLFKCPNRGQNSKLASLNLGQRAEVSSVDSRGVRSFYFWSVAEAKDSLLTTSKTVLKNSWYTSLRHEIQSAHPETELTLQRLTKVNKRSYSWLTGTNRKSLVKMSTCRVHVFTLWCLMRRSLDKQRERRAETDRFCIRELITSLRNIYYRHVYAGMNEEGGSLCETCKMFLGGKASFVSFFRFSLTKPHFTWATFPSC